MRATSRPCAHHTRWHPSAEVPEPFQHLGLCCRAPRVCARLLTAYQGVNELSGLKMPTSRHPFRCCKRLHLALGGPVRSLTAAAAGHATLHQAATTPSPRLVAGGPALVGSPAMGLGWDHGVPIARTWRSPLLYASRQRPATLLVVCCVASTGWWTAGPAIVGARSHVICWWGSPRHHQPQADGAARAPGPRTPSWEAFQDEAVRAHTLG